MVLYIDCVPEAMMEICIVRFVHGMEVLIVQDIPILKLPMEVLDYPTISTT